MLFLNIPMGPERWDEEKEEFVAPSTKTIQLEHSLISLSKWESKWHKPFLSKTPLTAEETLDYIRCMTLTKDVLPEVYDCITQTNIDKVLAYIYDPMTATTFGKGKEKKTSRKVMTAEVIYFYMFSYNIPYECRTWHLNRLMTLIRVFKEENEPKKKRRGSDLASEYAARNRARRQALYGKG